MPKKNFDIEINDLNKNPIVDSKGSVLMRTCIANALVTQSPDENPDGEEKRNRWKLANRISDGGDIDLLPEEIVLIKRLVGKSCVPLVVGPIFELLDQ